MSVPEEKKEFVMKQVFTDVVNMESDKLHYGKKEYRFNVPWRLVLYKKPNGGSLLIYNGCSKIRGTAYWSIETETELKLIPSAGEFLCKTNKYCYSNTTNSNSFLFSKAETDKYFVDGNLTVEMHVKITAMSKIKRIALRNFDESMKEFSDVVLKMEHVKFYVMKMYLAAHSTYFKSLFFGNFDESSQSEIELKDVDPYFFQNFLEVVYGEPAIDDNTIDGILQLAEMHDSGTTIRRCEEFFMNKSKQTLCEKFEAAVKYKMDKLRAKCFSDMKTKEDVLSVMPMDANEIEPTVWKEIVNKIVSFK